MSSNQAIDPSANDLTERLQRCYTGVVHDIMRAMGLRDFTLPPELRPIIPEQAIAGATSSTNTSEAGAPPMGNWRDEHQPATLVDSGLGSLPQVQQAGRCSVCPRPVL